MDSSPGFASAARDSAPCSDSLSLRLASWLGLATRRNSLAHSTKGTASHRPKAMLRLLVGRRFQVLFSLRRLLFTFPRGTSALSVTGVFRLEGGPPASHRVSRHPAVLGHRQAGVALRVRGSNPLWPGFPSGSARASLCNRTVDGPTTPARLSLGPVWPLPRSLATTGGISFDFLPPGAYRGCFSSPGCFSGPSVRLGGDIAPRRRAGFPFENPRVKGRVPLTADYRSLPRPSSASCAKASAACPYHLPSISDGMVSRLTSPHLRALGCHIA